MLFDVSDRNNATQCELTVVANSMCLLMSFALVQINNPDMRVVILKNFAKEHFPSTPLIDYAGEVELITTSKVC